ncbi:MAG: VIT1/CCC1 transporter family protein [Acidimicrobiia bacterium]|nr:MAG: VIT1/CCC1 transporter family protein [Acidimicrobiia bacterium]
MPGENTSETHPPGYQPHIGASRQYMRDIMLGVNDGLVSTFLLVSAVVGGGMDATDVLLTAIAGAIAGMISMAVGEYIATKSQEEVFEAELALERQHLKYHRQHEKDQLRDMLADVGLVGEDLEHVVEIINADDDAMLNMHAALEFGIVDTARRNPIAAAVFSGLMFLGGALPSVIPFAFVDSTGTGLLIAGILSGIGLLTVGAVKTLQTGKPPVRSALENFVLGMAGGVLAYVVGKAFDQLIN